MPPDNEEWKDPPEVPDAPTQPPAAEHPCSICHVRIAKDMDDPCDACSEKYGPHLCKAYQDNPFDYAVGLRDGQVLFVSGVDGFEGDWVLLNLKDEQAMKGGYPCPRGVQVRLSEIVWVADAPNGS